MKATFAPCRLCGAVDAPPSKSMAHRLLIGAALSGEKCTLSGMEYSEDVLATLDCLRALGARVEAQGDCVTVEPHGFPHAPHPRLSCRESGSTLRFFLPLALCLGREVTLEGSERLLERPLGVYEDLCLRHGFAFRREKNAIVLCGSLQSGDYEIAGGVSSQFITGLLFALVFLGGDSTLTVLPPFESRSYVDLTLSALRAFGADVFFEGEYQIRIRPARLHGYSGRVEGDYSNAAFLEAFRRTGSEIAVGNLSPESLQGDRVYAAYFDALEQGAPTLDLSDCPDLAPVLIALAALKNGATFTGTDRLQWKESDRGRAMHRELLKMGGGLLFGEDRITVPKQSLRDGGIPLSGHNDHRICMALSVILAQTGGTVEGAEAVKKSYPRFFEEIIALGAKVTLS